MQWPVRTAICLDCRTTLAAGTPCPHGAHRVVSLAERGGREALRDRVWGPRLLRYELRGAARAGSVGGLGGLFDGCWSCDGGDLDGHVLLGALVLFAAVFVLYLLIKWTVRAVRSYRNRPRPRGAPLARGRTGGIAATITSTVALAPAPIGDEPCVAFGVELRHGRWHAMLRDGATLGFDVELDDGTHARIPAGPCVIELGTARDTRAPAALAGYLASLDADHGCRSDQLELFPGDRVAVECLGPGDRIEIISPLVPDPGAGDPYRTGTRLVASAPVCLRRV